MKRARARNQESGGPSNVIAFQPNADSGRILRQTAIRDHLISLACKDGHDSAIASAVALMQPDGTLEISARGIEPGIAVQMSDAIDKLSDAVRLHAINRNRRQRGYAFVSMLVTLGFAAATYINQIAWIDAALMVAAQALVGFLASKTADK